MATSRGRAAPFAGSSAEDERSKPMLEWFDSNIWIIFGVSAALLMTGSYFAQARSSLLGFAIPTAIGVILLTLGIAGVCGGLHGELVEQGRTEMAAFLKYGMAPLFFLVICAGAVLWFFKDGEKAGKTQ